MSQNVNVNLVPGNYPKEFHVSQYDVGRQLVAKVVDSTGDYSIPSGATVVLVGTKPSGFGFTLNGTVSGSTVTFSTTATVTAEYGRIPCEIRIESGNTVLGTANCMLVVEMSPHPEGTTDGNSETVIPELTLLVERIEAAAESIHDLSVSATTLAAGSAATATYNSTTNNIDFGIPRGADGEVSQAELDAAVSDLKSALDDSVADLKDDLNVVFGDSYSASTIQPTTESYNYKLRDDGYAVADTAYKMYKYAVTEGDLLFVKSDYKFQFQNAAIVPGPSEGSTNRIGVTYGVGEWYYAVPTGATFLIICTPKSGSVAECKQVDYAVGDRIDSLDEAIADDGKFELTPVKKAMSAQTANINTTITADATSTTFVLHCFKQTELLITLTGSFNRFRVYGSSAYFDVGTTDSFSATMFAQTEKRDSGTTLKVNTGNYETIAIYAISADTSLSASCSVTEVKELYSIPTSSRLEEFVNGNFEGWGLTTGDTTRIRTDAFYVKKGSWLEIKANGQKYCPLFYDPSAQIWTRVFYGYWLTDDYSFMFNGAINNAINNSVYTYDDKVLFALMVAKTDNSALTPSDLLVEADLYSLHDATELANDIETNTKAITEKKNNIMAIGSPQIYYSEPTSATAESLKSKTVAELYAIYDGLVANYPHIIQRGADLGSGSSGDTIRQYIISFDKPYAVSGEVTLSGVLPPSTPNEWKSKNNNKTILVNTGCHGNEKSPTWGVALAVKEVVESSDKWAEYLKSNFTIKILPCMNPYGFANNSRRNANDVDLNRDCINFTQGESQAWKSFVDSNIDDAIAYLDCHGTSGYYAYFEALDSDIHYDEYLKAYLKFASCVNANWADYWSFTVNPYCLFARSTYSGMTIGYTSSLGLAGHILETPQDTDNAETGGWGDDLRSCKVTKDLLINVMQMYGEFYGK